MRARRRFSAWSSLATSLVASTVLALVSGCSAESLPPADPVVLESFSTSARLAACDWAVRCRHVPDRSTCERLIDAKDYDTRRAEDAVAAGRLAFDEVKGGECVRDIGVATCQTVPLTQPSCRQLFDGLRAQGETCTSRFECADGAECETPSCDEQCCVGRCGAPRTQGQPAKREGQGGPCGTHTDCQDGLYCELDNRCTPLPAEAGQDCLFGCAFGDLYCDIGSLTCRAFAGRGESCDPAGELAPPCDEAWAYCDQVCVDRPGPGQPCNLPGALCTPDSVCDGQVCQPRGDDGAPCAGPDDCVDACDEVRGQCVDYRTCEA